MSHLLAIGLGYSARVLAARLAARGWRVRGSSRTVGGVRALRALGFDAFVFDATGPIGDGDGIVGAATHLLVSAPPETTGDPVLGTLGEALAQAPALTWIGYLSTVGVYGDHGGGWVDETTPAMPTSDRGRARLAAENHWLDFGAKTGRRVHVFRLPGIYGPGRSAIDKLRDGTARRVAKPGQVFNRIHVDDIARVLEAAFDSASPERVFNVVDDEPGPPGDVVAFAAGLLGIEPPPEVAFDAAAASPMARSFYGENKRVANARIKSELGVRLAHPTYREGLRAILAGEAGAA